jgi:predicted phage baseplate assembly protein
MSGSLDPTLRNLNDCGCCEGIAGETPALIYNRPGLSALAYRVGTHALFKESMLARLSGSHQAALEGLKTRADDDFTIALLDAWATVADVLTFYQERNANESYLHTATERLSALELARLIDYKLGPGVAASTYLAFTLEDPPGATRQTATALGVPRVTTIDAGTKVQSIPGPGEQAQTFETVEQIAARVDWNLLKPRLTERHPINRDAETLFFAGLTTALKKGDGLLLTPDDGSESVFRQIAEVTLNDAQQRTEVRLQPLPSAAPVALAAPIFFQPVFEPSPITKKFLGHTINTADLFVASVLQNFAIVDIFDNLVATQPPPPSVLAFRTRAAIFGHNAPRWDTLPVSQRIGEFGPDPTKNPVVSHFIPGPYSTRQNSWAEQQLSNYPGESGNNIDLDSVYSNIVKDSRVVLKDGATAKPYQVSAATEVSKSDFTLSAKVTRLTLDTRQGFDSFNIRRTTVFGQSEELELARLPIDKPVPEPGAELVIELDTLVDGLSAGQKIIISGELDQVRGVMASELALIDKVDQVLGVTGATGQVLDPGFTRITLVGKLTNVYVRNTVTINANVALATHGETIQGIRAGEGEILGSGDASKSFQRFTLRQPPLTYVSASTPSGTQSTLEVRVNDLLWSEVPTLYGRGPEERIYVTELDDDGKTTVVFGDGKTGARLPTGQDNVKAKYRRGIGLPGLVKANQLSQLMTRPLGVKGVINPLAPTGAADRESLADARRNAPLTVLTLGRVVSIQDYEDFARAFAGIGKALATWSWSGEQRSVLVTVAGTGGAEVSEDSELYKNLLAALRQFGDPSVSLLLESYQARFFALAGDLQIAPDYLPDKVRSEVEKQLRERYSFDAREFGQPVQLSEVISVMQNVRGVTSVNVREFYRSDQPPDRLPRLAAARPQPGGDQIFAAELLTLDPRPLGLGTSQ